MKLKPAVSKPYAFLCLGFVLGVPWGWTIAPMLSESEEDVGRRIPSERFRAATTKHLEDPTVRRQ